MNENGFHLPENQFAFLLKLAATSLSDGFQWKEKPLNKKKGFPLARKSVFASLSEEILLFLTIPIRDLWKMEKKCFPLARKSVAYLQE